MHIYAHLNRDAHERWATITRFETDVFSDTELFPIDNSLRYKALLFIYYSIVILIGIFLFWFIILLYTKHK